MKCAQATKKGLVDTEEVYLYLNRLTVQQGETKSIRYGISKHKGTPKLNGYK